MRPKAPKAPDFPGGHLRAESVPRPVAALSDSLSAGSVVPPHSHGRDQLVYAIRGCLIVQAGDALWMLPASHALWLPAGVVHQIRVKGSAELRTLFIKPEHMPLRRKECAVLYVSPLLRELIARAMQFPPLYDERGDEGRLMKVLLDEISRLPPQPLGLRMPADSRLKRLCEHVLQDVSAMDSIESLGALVGLSERSVVRLFPQETGLSFGQWVKQARLLKAFEMFDGGRTVTQVALDLGYSSPAAFSKMFRRLMGKAPTQMLN